MAPFKFGKQTAMRFLARGVDTARHVARLKQADRPLLFSGRRVQGTRCAVCQPGRSTVYIEREQTWLALAQLRVPGAPEPDGHGTGASAPLAPSFAAKSICWTSDQDASLPN